MTKFLIFIAFACIVVASSLPSRFDRKIPINKRLASVKSTNGSSNPPTICENGTVAKAFLAKLRHFVENLESNSSYGPVCQKHVQTINYIKSDTKAAVLSSNCTEYIVGLKNAQKLDTKAAAQEAKIEENVDRAYKLIIKSFFGVHNLLSDDF